jgi:Domain of unknown function (DUF4136)
MKHKFPLVALLFISGAFLYLGAKVSTDYSHSADFGQYHTYSWLQVKAGNDLWTDRIRRAVDNELMAKGWMETPSGGQASVTAFGATKQEQQLQTFYDGLGGGWFWRGFGGDGLATTTVENVPVGTLVVDVFDSQSKKLLWRGHASETLSGDPEKNEKKLDHEVSDMFKHFPPKTGG